MKIVLDITTKENETLHAEKVNDILLLTSKNVDGTQSVDLLISHAQVLQLKDWLNTWFWN